MSNSRTSFLLATVSIGIAAGFVCAGKISGGHIHFRLVKIGALGLAICLLLLALPASFTQERWSHLLGIRGSYVALIFSGFFAGLFALPVQVYLQARPPQKIKGRVIGAMNLVNWIAIVLAAFFFFLSDELLQFLNLPKFSIFGITGLLLLPIAFFYRSDKVSLVTESDNEVD
jgi:MFS family permease